MEDTYSLISKLVQTKSIEKVLSPIAAKVSQLIIVNEAFENGDQNAFPDDLVPSATCVMKSTQGLVQAANRLLNKYDDEVLKNEMPKACEALSVSGTNQVIAAQRVQIENYSTASRKHLIRTAKDVLESTLKVLLVLDDAEIRKITKAIKSTRERLGILTVVHSMKALVSTFKSFAESVVLLTSVVDKRQLELIDQRQREAVLSSLGTLKQCVPMLNSSLQTSVKYPNNPQAKASKLYAVGQIMECLDNLESGVQSKDSVSEDYEEPEMPGHFVSNIDRVLNLLGEEQRLELHKLGSELDAVVESLIHHSMSVSHLSSQQHRTNIIRRAQQLLKFRSEVADLCETLRDGDELVTDDFSTRCQCMMAEAQQLESAVSSATLWLVVDVFKETTEPLERLIKVMLSDDKDTWLCYSSIEDYENDFHEHFDKVGQVSRFTAATSVDANKVRTINNCLSVLDHIDPELIPAIRACRSSPGDQAAIEHLRLMKNEWISSLNVLVHTVDELVDGQMFIEISESELRKAVDTCKESQISDVALVHDVTRSLIGRAQRMGLRALTIIGRDCDVVYRNRVRSCVNKVNKAVPVVKSAASFVLRDFDDRTLHEKLHKSCAVLLKYVTFLKDGILHKSSSDILVPDTQMVCPDECQGDFNQVHNDSCGDCIEYPDKLFHPDTSGSSQTRQHIQPDAIKCYLSAVIHDNLLEMTRQLLSASIGGYRQKLELICNSLLSYSNNITESANSVANLVKDKNNKKLLVDCSSKVNELTPQIIDKASKVCDCDTYQIEPLHQVIDTWSKQASLLQNKLDVILVKWKHVSDNVLDAIKLSDVQLLKAQIEDVHCHHKHVIKMLDGVCLLANEMDTVMIQKSHSLKEDVSQLTSLTTNLITMAEDQVKHSSKNDEYIELGQVSRLWAATLYHIMASCDELCNVAVISYVARPLYIDNVDCIKLGQYMSAVTEINMALKSYIESALVGCIIEKYVSDGERAICDIDNVSVDITQCYSLMTGVRTTSEDIITMYTPHQLNILLWKWALTVHRTKFMLGKWTSHCTGHINSYLQAVVRVHDEHTDNVQRMHDINCKKYLDSIREMFSKARTKILDMIQSSNDRESKDVVQRHIESWSVITEELQTLGNALLEDGISDLKKENFVMAKIHWGVKCLEIDGCMKSLPGIRYDSIAGFVRCLAAQLTVPSTSLTPTSSDVNKHHLSKGPGVSKMNAIPESPSAPVKKESNSEWKKLAAGPRVKHSTPELPSSKSGFKLSNTKTTTKIWPASRHLTCDQWNDNNNDIVKIAHDISDHLQNMTQFTKGMGPIRSREELISAAKNVAKNGEKLVKFAKILVKYSIDKRVSEDLRCSADYIPTVIAQLNILASVKSATPDDRSTEKMLVKTGNNLLDAINKMLRNAEAVCVKGLKHGMDLADGESESLMLASQWHHQFQRHRLLESSMAAVDNLGLRKVSHHSDLPTLSDIMGTK